MTGSKRTSSLLVINLILLLVIAALWLTDIGIRLDTVPTRSVVTEDGQPGASAGLKTPPIEDYKAIIERPLFANNRRPEKKPVPVKQQPVQVDDKAQQKVPFKLIGSLVMPSGNEAMLKMTSGGEVFRRRSGEALQGWTVDTVYADSVVVHSGDSAIELYLERRSSSQPPPRPAPRAQPKPVKQQAGRQLRVRK